MSNQTADHSHTYSGSGTTGAESADHNHGFSTSANATGISIQNAGNGQAHQNMPPTMMVGCIMRVL